MAPVGFDFFFNDTATTEIYTLDHAATLIGFLLLLRLVYYNSCNVRGVHTGDVYGSAIHNINRIEMTNKMRPCSRIYYSNVS
jgi:hypothetical protein